MDNLMHTPQWRVVKTRIEREIEQLRTHLVSTPDADKMRQLQGAAQALESLLSEIGSAHNAIQQRQE